MKKNLSVRLLFGAALVASLVSCRSEDFLNSHEEAPPSKFRVFTAQKDETVNYGKGFKTLLEHYDDIHKVQHTAQAVRNALKNSLKTTGEYVEMNIRSQDFTTKTNEKFTLFPLIKNQQVDGIIIAVLKENETQVEFLKMYPEAENYSEMLKLFREAYLKNTLPQRLAAKANGSCSSDGTPCDTGEVIITMPGAGGGYTGGTWNGDTLPVGGCLPYDNCLNPEGGGGSGGGETTPTNNNPPENPCEKTKSIVDNLKSKPAIDDMKSQSGLPASDPNSGEIGYKFKEDGTPSPKIVGGKHNVNFGDKTGYAGGYHNHTTEGIPMLSPPDIEQLLQFALAQGNYGNPSDAFMGMVAPNGMYYVATFSGSYNDALISFSQQDLNNFTDNMAIRKSIYNPSTAEGFEKLFFSILNDMSLNGKINLQRIENDGTIKTVTKNNDGTTTAVPCP